MRTAVALALLGGMLAGCAGEPGESAPTGSAGNDVTSISAPTWEIGDWWTYDLGGLGIVTWVVTEDLGSDWMVDIDNEELRWGHDAFEQVSTVGRVSKAHAAGSQEAGPVEFFRFPLEENKTWSMTWDNTQFEATVTDISGETAEIQARADDGQLRVYIYDNATQWFRMIRVYDANETELYTVQIDRSGRDYGGAYYRWTLHPGLDLSYGVGGGGLSTFEVPEDASDIWYSYHIVCDPDGLEGDQGGYVFEVHPGSGNNPGISATGVCPTPQEATGALEATPGEWGVTSESLGGRIDALIIPRTLHELRL